MFSAIGFSAAQSTFCCGAHVCANMPCVRGNRNVERVCECVRRVRALTSETVTGPARRVRLMSMRPLPSADWCALWRGTAVPNRTEAPRTTTILLIVRKKRLYLVYNKEAGNGGRISRSQGGSSRESSSRRYHVRSPWAWARVSAERHARTTAPRDIHKPRD